MKNLALALICVLVGAAAVKAGESVAVRKPTSELVAAMQQIRNLNAEDFTALKLWLSGNGRKALRARGVTDADIGGARLDTDKWGDAPLSE